jgi:hypothetical protein
MPSSFAVGMTRSSETWSVYHMALFLSLSCLLFKQSYHYHYISAFCQLKSYVVPLDVSPSTHCMLVYWLAPQLGTTFHYADQVLSTMHNYR